MTTDFDELVRQISDANDKWIEEHRSAHKLPSLHTPHRMANVGQSQLDGSAHQVLDRRVQEFALKQVKRAIVIALVVFWGSRIWEAGSQFGVGQLIETGVVLALLFKGCEWVCAEVVGVDKKGHGHK